MLLDQHRAINDALQNRDPVAGRAAIRAHLDFVEEALFGQQKSEKNEKIAKLRYEHEQSR